MDDSISIKFLNSIQYRFNLNFSNDFKHRYLIEEALVTKKLNSFVHIIECCIAKYVIFAKQSKELKCKTCINNNIEKSISYISMYAKNLTIFFSSYFYCPLNISTEFFSRFKSAVFTTDGMHLFDHLTSSIAYIKWLNKTEQVRDPDYESVWLGGLYFDSEPIEAFESSINFIKSDSKWNKIAFYGLTGNPLQPSHFFAIFFVKSINSIFIYNSCPSELGLIKEYKEKFNNYKIFINEYKNQFNNDLCGFFSLIFIEKMALAPDLFECFAKFNLNKNMDKEIEEYQKASVHPVRKKYKLIDFFLNDWKNDCDQLGMSFE